MWCPSCGDLEDRVVDSRTVQDGRVIRRRRECLTCGHRSTTLERLELAPIALRKRDGSSLPFDPEKIVAGVLAAAKHRPVTEADGQAIAETVEDALRSGEIDHSTEHVGAVVLKALRALDEVTYLRFASVYKSFDDPSDFEREALELAIQRAGEAEAEAEAPSGSAAVESSADQPADAPADQSGDRQASPTS